MVQGKKRTIVLNIKHRGVSLPSLHIPAEPDIMNLRKFGLLIVLHFTHGFVNIIFCHRIMISYPKVSYLHGRRKK